MAIACHPRCQLRPVVSARVILPIHRRALGVHRSCIRIPAFATDVGFSCFQYRSISGGHAERFPVVSLCRVVLARSVYAACMCLLCYDGGGAVRQLFPLVCLSSSRWCDGRRMPELLDDVDHIGRTTALGCHHEFPKSHLIVGRPATARV
jgi:hypothetical protein